VPAALWLPRHARGGGPPFFAGQVRDRVISALQGRRAMSYASRLPGLITAASRKRLDGAGTH
jgi:hypothetical protein